MKLKKVEIKGFKSFAFKTEIMIKDGITAIVGPNGSGKSNISDAIRWVLGEQSIKNLRGQKMEDVIFAGTSTRKPLGYCEVAITFDNKSGIIPLEYELVEVTRRMFRSGESQYYINKGSCRLKDVREIFMDTGIGKDGYSIIGQGRIDEILSNKPEDRRSIFEEAAGIVKYKSKKNEAEKKLEKTESNLIRIKDLVYEISKQRDILKIQAEKAKEFNLLYVELKDLEVNLLASDIRKHKNQYSEINKDKKILEDQLNELIEKRQKTENNFDDLKCEINEIEKNIECSRDYNATLINKRDKNKNTLAIIDEKNVFHRKNLERLLDERNNINIKLDERSSFIEKISKDLDDYIEKYQETTKLYLEKEIKFKNQSKYLNEKEDEIEHRKDNILNVYNEIADIKSKANSMLSFNQNITMRIERLNKDVDMLSMKKDENKKNLKDEKEKRQISAQTLQSLKDSASNIEDKLNKANKSLLNINEEKNKDNLDKQSKLSRLNLLKSMEEDYEGYYKGVKSVLIESKKNASIGNGLIGVVAEMIKVNAKHEKAIEVSLGSSGQNIVTENEKNAKNIIEYLKKNKLGRVTCLPLNIIKERLVKLTDSDKEEFNIIGRGDEIAEYDSRYDSIFKYLLGRTIIIDDIDSAIAFSKKTKHVYRIVTLQGEVLNPGGSMTGGAHRGSGVNIINRKNRIEELNQYIEEMNLKLVYMKDQANQKIDIIKSLESELKTIKNEIQEKELNIHSIDNNISNYKGEIIRIDNTIRQSNKELLDLNNEEREYISEYEKLNIRLLNIENNRSAEKDKIKKLIQVYNTEKEKTQSDSKFLADIKLDLNEIKIQIKNSEEKIDNIKNIQIELLDDLEDKNLSIKSNEEEIKNIIVSKEKLKMSINHLSVEQKEMEDKLNNLLHIKKEKMENFYYHQENLKDTNMEISLKEKNLNSIEIKLTKLATELKNYENRLLDEYELKFEDITEKIKDIDDIKNATNKIKKLKTSIKKIGNVNLSSIEEYRETDERLDFILNQKNDLMEAKKNLNNIILNMESKMEKQFLLNFEKINENFVEVFKTLFNGGKAELILENKEDILNTGIQINAQPPGKKLQSLTLLSGGEKSLTAVALLFSILNLRPAPFCILDEIDASLDEANISKYTAYLKNFSFDTQFVLITHRKTTMEIADNLYGVTMEEDGISKLISVKLTDYIEGLAS